MSFLRRLALNISAGVVRYASPGSKDWAEGLAREVAFIPGDWAALVWALGSVRVLFDYREAPLVSFADLPVAAKKVAKAKHSGDGTWILSFYFGLTYGGKFFHAANGLERIGCAMAVLGWILLGIVSLIEWCSEIKMPPSDDILALIRFYNARLERARDSYRSIKGLIGISAVIFILLGLMLAQQGWVYVRVYPWFDLCLGLTLVGILLLVRQIRRTNRRRLEDLNTLLVETHIDGL